ncbi:hypothetical protein [Streptomyces sp. NPDC002692]
MPTSIRATGEAKEMTLNELAQFVEDARKAERPRRVFVQRQGQAG